MEKLWSKSMPPTITDINEKLKTIPETHRQEALNTILYNLIIHYPTSTINLELIEMGAVPPKDFESVSLIATYGGDPQVFSRLLEIVKQVDSDFIQMLVNDNDKHVLETIEKKWKNRSLITVYPNTDKAIIKLLGKYANEPPQETNPILLHPWGLDEFNFLKLNYITPFKLENAPQEGWDTLERYIAYKLYENTPKGNVIKNAPVDEISELFLLKPLGEPKNTKEMLIMKDKGDVANSIINKKNLENKIELLYNATLEKFNQHPLLKNKLIETGDREIIEKNIHSIGYEGNLFGIVLMRVRAHFKNEKTFVTNKNNNLTIKKYSTKFYVVRGDADEEISTKLRTLATFKSSSGKTVYGKLSFNLSGGPGWLIPFTHIKEAKELVRSTWPVEEQLSKLARKWVSHKLVVILEMAKKIVTMLDKNEIGTDDIMLIIRDIYPCSGFLGTDFGEPSKEFIKSVNKTTNIPVSEAAIKILWDFLGNMAITGFKDVETVKQFHDQVTIYQKMLMNKKVPMIKSLSERESLFLTAFLKMYNVLKNVSGIKNPTVASVKILINRDDIGKNIKDRYASIIKDKKNINDSSLTGKIEETEAKVFKEKFGIKLLDLDTILLNLGFLDKKNKLLVLIAIEELLKKKSIDEELQINKTLLSTL